MPAFRLDVPDDGHATLTFDLPDRRANIFTREALAELETLIPELAARTDLKSLTLRSGKPGIFIAGADVDAIADVTDPAIAAEGSRAGHRLFSAWEALPFPTVAAIRGTCVGGGTELSLACSAIAISDGPGVRIGLPEVQLGILPGWGGCIRMPRRLGLLAALDLILQGKTVSGDRAWKMGLADALFPHAGFERHVAEWVRREGGPKRRPRKVPLAKKLLEGNPLGRAFVCRQARKQTRVKTGGHYPAPLRAIDVIATGLGRGRAVGFEAEARAIGELAVSAEAKNLIHLFRLIEANKKEEGEATAVRRPAVIGAGVMGGGIGALIAEKTDLPVRIKDIRPEALGVALEHAGELFRKRAKRRRWKKHELRRRLGLLQPTLEDAGLAACDFVVEAVVERLDVKQAVFEGLSKRMPADAILASNTSSLSIDAIGARAERPERVVGMHFFNPVDRMPLVEVVTGPRTSDATSRAVAAFARRLGKTPIVVREGPGFLVNRLLAFYSAEALWLLDEGHAVEAIDRAMRSWGMPMGPLRLADEVGLDVSAHVAEILHDAFPERLTFPEWTAKFAGTGRLGVKTGGGIYKYEGRKETGVDTGFLAELGLANVGRASAPAGELAERMVLPMVNEAARCLDEGIVAGPGPLDLAMIFGTGFPPFRGGLCRWADGEGLPALVARLDALAGSVGARLRPSPALRRFAEAGGFYADGADG